MRFRLHEPAVALTDLLIGVEAGVFALILARANVADAGRTRPAAALRRWFVVLFAATSVAALAGGALHGLFPDRGATGRLRLWRISLGSIGLSGLAGWGIAAVIALPTAAANRLLAAVAAAHAAYLIGLTRTNPPYMVAIAVYLPGAAALGLALVTRVRRRALRTPAAIGLAGLGLTFVAAVVQLRRIALHPRIFDHNATYHAIQAIAIGCFYLAARGFVRPSRRRSRDVHTAFQFGGRR